MRIASRRIGEICARIPAVLRYKTPTELDATVPILCPSTHVRRDTERGTTRQHVCTEPSRDALASMKDQVCAGPQRTTTEQSRVDRCVQHGSRR